MGIHKESKNKKGMVRKGIVRFFDLRDDRTAGEDSEDGYEESSPLVIDKTLGAKPKHEK